MRLCVACVVAFFSVGCGLFPSDSGGGHGVARLGRLTLSLQIGSDGRLYQPRLAKPAVTLSRAIVTLKSSRGEVLYDTITSQGSRLSREPAYLLESSSEQQELLLRYELHPSSSWNIDVKVFDTQDSVRYSGAITIEDMDAFEYLDGCLPVDPRYAVIEGRFRLPEAVEADGIPTSQRALRNIYLSRLTLLVDNSVITERVPFGGPGMTADERFITAPSDKLVNAAGKRFFRPSPNPEDPPLIVSHDYGNVLNSEFTVAAYGYVEGDTVGVTPERLLFQGTRMLDLSAAKVTVEEPVTMVWKAVDAVPVDINTGFDVRLGRAGKVVIDVVIPGGITI